MYNFLIKSLFILFSTIFIFTNLSFADDFSLEFEWGDIKKCTWTGSGKKAQNPIFKLSNVPEGTISLNFRMTDKSYQNSDHGGGRVEYKGNDIREPGQFKYWSPCPPRNKQHTYEWRVVAKDKDNKALGITKAKREYPEEGQYPD